jgi:hypothetical protein
MSTVSLLFRPLGIATYLGFMDLVVRDENIITPQSSGGTKVTSWDDQGNRDKGKVLAELRSFNHCGAWSSVVFKLGS